MTERTCTGCKVTKPIGDFYLKYVGGTESQCKPCKDKDTKLRQQGYRERWSKEDPYEQVGRKKCSACKKKKKFSSFQKNKSSSVGVQSKCRSCTSISDKLRNKGFRQERRSTVERNGYNSLREEIIDKYGGKCTCCGESEEVFLAMDHVNDDGAADRKKNGKNLYRIIKKLEFPDTYQILCHNCNWAKYKNKGLCPHKVSISETI